MRYIGMLLALASAQAWGGSFWSDDPITNTAMITANTLIIADWAQTRHIADNPDQFREVGMAENFIGEHPSTGDVNRYFAISLALTNAMAYFMPEDKKKWFYIGVSLYEADYVKSNMQIGIKGEF
jgi:hypothetical protein